jgi:hypothetical protein
MEAYTWTHSRPYPTAVMREVMPSLLTKAYT